MSLIIELLPWGRQAVRESIVGVGALVGIDAGQPSDHRLVDVAAAYSARCTSRERNWAAGVLLRGWPLPAFHPLRGCSRAKCGILPTRSLALCAVHFLVTGRRIFDSIQGAHAALLFSLPGRIIDIRG